jgi:hypothetical protein
MVLVGLHAPGWPASPSRVNDDILIIVRSHRRILRCNNANGSPAFLPSRKTLAIDTGRARGAGGNG